MKGQEIKVEKLISKVKLQRNIVFTIGIIILISIMLHETLLTDKLSMSYDSWASSAEYTSKVSKQLILLEQEIGLDGIIHIYKDWIIHRDDKYTLMLESRMDDLQKIISVYNAIPGLSKDEHEALTQIHKVLTRLFKNYYLSLQGNYRTLPPDQLDDVLRIDFTSFIQAIKLLQNKANQAFINSHNQSKSEFEQLLDSFNYRYVLLVLMLGVLIIFYWINKRLINLNLLLDDSEEMIRNIINSIPVAVVLVDQQGQIQHFNYHAVELFGYSEETLENMSVESLMPEEYRKKHVNYRYNYMVDFPTQVQTQPRRKMRVLNADGDILHVETSLANIQTENGQLVVASIIEIN